MHGRSVNSFGFNSLINTGATERTTYKKTMLNIKQLSRILCAITKQVTNEQAIGRIIELVNNQCKNTSDNSNQQTGNIST